LGLGSRQALRLEEQIVHVSIAAAASEQSFEIAVDGFDQLSHSCPASSKRLLKGALLGSNAIFTALIPPSGQRNR